MFCQSKPSKPWSHNQGYSPRLNKAPHEPKRTFNNCLHKLRVTALWAITSLCLISAEFHVTSPLMCLSWTQDAASAVVPESLNCPWQFAGVMSKTSFSGKQDKQILVVSVILHWWQELLSKISKNNCKKQTHTWWLNITQSRSLFFSDLSRFIFLVHYLSF